MSIVKVNFSNYTEGVVICLDCKHEWEVVASLRTKWLKCPSCGLIRGRFKYPYSRDGEEWVCDCGNDLFHMKPEGIYCPNCGVWQKGW